MMKTTRAVHAVVALAIWQPMIGARQEPVAAQWVQSPAGETAVVALQNAPFPHPSRESGFKNGTRDFPREPHYADASVALFVPSGYRSAEAVDVLVYLHGHFGNVRRSMDRHRLREQVAASGRNVVMVFPQGPKDAADSGCGKLEDAGGLKRLVDEAVSVMRAAKKMGGSKIGRVVIAGHSGAYRGISYCIERGGLSKELTDVGLLDASYGRLDSFVDWSAQHAKGTLFSIFTDHLAKENVYLMTHLRQRGVVYSLAAEQDVKDDETMSARIQFLHAEKLTHDQTVRWLERWLRTRSLPTRTP